MNSTTKAAIPSRRQPRQFPARRTAALKRQEKYILRLAILYQDNQTRQWAQEVHKLAAKLVGRDSLAATWWNIQVLNEPAVLAGAVSTAMHSDVTVLALRADSELPLAFYYWADAWLPHRYEEPGALLALLGVSEHAQARSGRIREYLATLSRRGGLDFMFDERPLPAASTPSLHCDATMKRAVAGTVLRTMAYRDGRNRYWQQVTRMAA